VAVYGTSGRTPFTGAVPLYLVDKLSSVNGVLAISAETVAPCVLDDKSVFVRGVASDEFSSLNNLTILQGESLDMINGHAAIVGVGLSRRLGLSVGDRILVFGVLSEQYVELEIKGVYVSNSAIDDEALVPLYVGQWLRGISYGQVTLIRVKIDPSEVTANALFEVLAKEASAPASTPNGEKPLSFENLIPFVQVGFQVSDIGVDRAQNFMQSYLEQYGVTKNTLVVLSVLVLVFASGTSICALAMFLDQHKREIGIIYNVGASTRRIKFDLLVKVLSWSLVSSVLGVVLAAGVIVVFGQIGYLQILSHRVSLQLDPLIIVVNFVLISLLVTVGIIRWDVN
jgi:ABC-type lipoprotein release transport system permease subunit